MVLGYKISQFCTQNETIPGHNIRPLVLQGSKSTSFCLKQGQGFKALAAHLLKTAPPPRPLLGLNTGKARDQFLLGKVITCISLSKDLQNTM